MPLPMVHLGIAVKYFDNGDVPESFLLGSIAPDSIHMRENTSREDKKRTHFSDQGIVPSSLEQHYTRFIGQSADADWEWFVRGYFAHVLTDYYWIDSVYANYLEQTGKYRLSKEETRINYYTETDEIDFYLYETKEWKNKVWKSLINAKTYSMSPLLNDKEINYWRFRTVHWFDLLMTKPGIEPKFITHQAVETFIVGTAELIRETIEEWDERLLEEVATLANKALSARGTAGERIKYEYWYSQVGTRAIR